MWRSRAAARLLLSSTRRVPQQIQARFHFFAKFPTLYPKYYDGSSASLDRAQICRFFSNESVHGSFSSANDDNGVADSPFDDLGSESGTSSEDEKDKAVDLGENFSEEAVEIDAEKIENLLSFLQSTTEDSLDVNFEKMDLELSEDFIVRVLETPLTLPDKLISFFIWASQRPEYKPSSNTLTILVRSVASSAVCNKREAYMLWDLIKNISLKDKQLLTTEILNQLLSLFGKLEKSKAALEVFNLFDDIGLKPIGESYYLTINALSQRSMIDAACSVCEKMINSGELPDADQMGKIISFFCKMKRAKEAYLVYLLSKEKSKSLPGFYIDFLVIGLARDDDSVLTALELLKDYSGERRKYSIKPFTSVIKGLCRKKEFPEAKNLVNEMINSGPPPGSSVFNHVISSLSKAGEMDDAVSLLRLMEGRGLRPDIFTYSVIMSGFSKGGLMEEARKIFNEAKERHPSLISTVYHILIRGYCKIEEFDAALECMQDMKNDGIQPNADEYNKMVFSLCLKALDWRSAEKLLDEVKESGLTLNPMTRGLVTAIKELEEEETRSSVLT
ncbi:tetratricopeptide repeat (TPR)-like superfamily protein [Wolffia australiana]